MRKWMLVALVIAAGCASTGRGGERPSCAQLHVSNYSWDDVVLRTEIRRLGNVVSQTRERFRVCGHGRLRLQVGVDAIGDRVRYVVVGDGRWVDGMSYTMVIENHPALSVLHPSYQTGR